MKTIHKFPDFGSEGNVWFPQVAKHYGYQGVPGQYILWKRLRALKTDWEAVIDLVWKDDHTVEKTGHWEAQCLYDIPEPTGDNLKNEFTAIEKAILAKDYLIFKDLSDEEIEEKEDWEEKAWAMEKARQLTEQKDPKLEALTMDEVEFISAVLETQGFQYVSQEASVLKAIRPWEEAQSRTQNNLILLRDLMLKFRDLAAK